eukprot:scaffold74332_cov18-Prasinocladus_malaysianus.AAC.1
MKISPEMYCSRSPMPKKHRHVVLSSTSNSRMHGVLSRASVQYDPIKPTPATDTPQATRYLPCGSV